MSNNAIQQLVLGHWSNFVASYMVNITFGKSCYFRRVWTVESKLMNCPSGASMEKKLMHMSVEPLRTFSLMSFLKALRHGNWKMYDSVLFQ